AECTKDLFSSILGTKTPGSSEESKNSEDKKPKADKDSADKDSEETPDPIVQASSIFKDLLSSYKEACTRKKDIKECNDISDNECGCLPDDDQSIRSYREMPVVRDMKVSFRQVKEGYNFILDFNVDSLSDGYD